MKKYLLCFFSVFINFTVYADIVVDTEYGINIARISNCSNINVNEIKDLNADKFEISNSTVVIDNFSDWQNWDADVDLSNVTLQLDDIESIPQNIRLEHVSSTSVVVVTVKNQSSLYKTYLSASYDDVFLSWIRETNYVQVFEDSSGGFLEDLRQNHPDDKTLLAMDGITNEFEIKSIMNSSYHFNPMILMKPIKIINSVTLMDTDFDTNNVGTKFDYVISNKLSDVAGHLYFGGNYNNFNFRVGVNLNKFSYEDSLNEFDGFVYGLDLRVKQYLSDFWIDGLVGFSKAIFDADYIYQNETIMHNPKGLSEYARLGIGYDFTKITDFTISPFIGVMFQESEIMGMSDTDTNLLIGTNGKYNFVMDGIKYEYSLSIASDEKLNWHIGADIGFISVVDNIGAAIGVNVFKDEFDNINYKLSLNAKVRF